jgi:hypothetical protein
MMISKRLSAQSVHRGIGVFRPDGCVIRADRILRLQGYRDFAKVRPAIRNAAEAMAKRASELISPEVHYRSVGVRAVTGDGVVLADGTQFQSEAFGHFLPHAKRIVAIIVTLGRGLDEEVSDLIDRFEPLEALLLESAGWLGIELASKAFADRLRLQGVQEGLHATIRMAPGYTYRIAGAEVSWPLEQQREVFSLFSGHELPVRLLSSCAMTPKMSRSGLYGLVPVVHQAAGAVQEVVSSSATRDQGSQPNSRTGGRAVVPPVH